MARRTTRSRRSGGSSRRKAGGPISIPSLHDVEARVVIPEGDWGAKVKKVEEDEGDAGPYLRWTFEITDEGKYEGKSPKPYVTSFAENSLWNLRGLLEALDVEIPEEAFEIDPDDMVDRELIITIRHDEYEGRPQSEVAGFMPIDEGEPAPEKEERSSRRSRREEPEPEKEERSSRRSRRSEPEPEPERSSRRSRRSEPEPEKEERSSRRGGRSSKKEEKKEDTITQSEISDMGEDELEDVIKEFELDVDLSKFRTLRKMRAAVIDAAEAEDVLEKDE